MANKHGSYIGDKNKDGVGKLLFPWKNIYPWIWGPPNFYKCCHTFLITNGNNFTSEFIIPKSKWLCWPRKAVYEFLIIGILFDTSVEYQCLPEQKEKDGLTISQRLIFKNLEKQQCWQKSGASRDLVNRLILVGMYVLKWKLYILHLNILCPAHAGIISKVFLKINERPLTL